MTIIINSHYIINIADHIKWVLGAL